MIFVTDTPYPERNDPSVIRFVLWADTAAESLCAVYAAGADPEACRITTMNTVDAYWLTPEQFADVVTMGITITDKWGLVEWCARRDGRADRLTVLRAMCEHLGEIETFVRSHGITDLPSRPPEITEFMLDAGVAWPQPGFAVISGGKAT